MYRIMYKLDCMSRHESAVVYDESTDSLVEAHFETKEAAEVLMQDMVRQAREVECDIQIRIEKVRTRK